MESIEQSVMGVYRIDTNGSIHLAAANVPKPNGIIISPDQKTLYVVNNNDGLLRFPSENDSTVPRSTQEGSVMAYNLLPDGSLQFKDKLIAFSGRAPDGMAIDVEGNLYLAMGDIVEVYSPDGKKITDIKTPAATNLCFGRGRFSQTLFIAGGKSIYMVETTKKGYNISFKKAGK